MRRIFSHVRARGSPLGRGRPKVHGADGGRSSASPERELSVIAMNPCRLERGPRVAVRGPPGSGKTTLGRRLAVTLGAAHTELDQLGRRSIGLFTPVPEFRAEVNEIAHGSTWIIDGNFVGYVDDIVLRRATAVVWLDFSRPRVLSRVLLRSLRRAVALDSSAPWDVPRGWLSANHPIRWSMASFSSSRRQVLGAIAENPELDWVRLRTPREVTNWFGDGCPGLGPGQWSRGKLRSDVSRLGTTD